jgi:hypothetical protein
MVLGEAKKGNSKGNPDSGPARQCPARRLNSVGIQAANLAAWNGDGSSPTFFVMVAILLFNLEGGTKDGTL